MVIRAIPYLPLPCSGIEANLKDMEKQYGDSCDCMDKLRQGLSSLGEGGARDESRGSVGSTHSSYGQP